MISREDVVHEINVLLNNNHKIQKKKTAQHIGVIELRHLLDIIYESKPMNKKQYLINASSYDEYAHSKISEGVNG